MRRFHQSLWKAPILHAAFRPDGLQAYRWAKQRREQCPALQRRIHRACRTLAATSSLSNMFASIPRSHTLKPEVHWKRFPSSTSASEPICSMATWNTSKLSSGPLRVMPGSCPFNCNPWRLAAESFGKARCCAVRHRQRARVDANGTT